MKKFNGRKLLAAFALSGITVAGTILGAGAATADPLDSPLMNSTCTFAQIDRALHAEHPDIAAKLDAHPDRKAMLQRMYDQPIEQRKAQAQQWMNQNPDKVQKRRQWAQSHPNEVAQHRAVEAELANTCHNY